MSEIAMFHQSLSGQLEQRFPSLYFFPNANLPSVAGSLRSGTVTTSPPFVLPVMIGLFGMVS
jgi:hypothetical protein